MSRAPFIAALGALLCGLGCAGDPEAAIFLYGRVQSNAGRALAREPVALSRGAIEGAQREAPVENCSFGRSFPEQQRPAVFEPFKHTETDDDGRFLFQLLRYELATFSCYRIDVEGEKSGAKTSVWTTLGPTQAIDLYLDRVYRWDEGAISHEPAVDGHRLSAAPGPLPRSEKIRFAVEDAVEDIVAYEWALTASGKPLWRAELTAATFLVEGPIREDFAEVEAHGVMLSILVPPDLEPSPLLGWGARYVEHATGPSVFLPSMTPRLPASRGAPCSIGAAPLDPCPATDGKLDLATFSFPFPNKPEDGLVLELAAPASPSLAILRDVWSTSAAITLEGSPDGVVWSPLGSLQQPWNSQPVVMDSLGPYEWHTIQMRMGRFLRVELTPPAQPIVRIRARGFRALRELSVFE
jgi:hypothetical protein